MLDIKLCVYYRCCGLLSKYLRTSISNIDYLLIFSIKKTVYQRDCFWAWSYLCAAWATFNILPTRMWVCTCFNMLLLSPIQTIEHDTYKCSVFRSRNNRTMCTECTPKLFSVLYWIPYKYYYTRKNTCTAIFKMVFAHCSTYYELNAYVTFSSKENIP